MDQGWIKIHLELLGKPIWTETTPEQKVLLVTLYRDAYYTKDDNDNAMELIVSKNSNRQLERQLRFTTNLRGAGC